VRLAAPSLRGVVRIVAVVVACIVALYLLWRVRGVVRLAAIALFVALALNPVVHAIDVRLRVPRAAIILALFVALTAGVVVVGAVVVPSMVKQVQQLSHEAPRYVQDLRRNSTLRHYDEPYGITAKLASEARAPSRRLGKGHGAAPEGREGVRRRRSARHRAVGRFPYALSLGVVVGFFDLIPLVGATLGAIIVALSPATVDFPTTTLVWVAFVVD
jgi:predicted PurR-regulated permease PerM